MTQPITTEEFVRLLAANQRRIFSLIRALVPHRVDADDVFQETCVVLWREKERFRPDADFAPWALAIAFNQVRTYRLKNQRNRLTFRDDVLQRIASAEEGMRPELDDRNAALAGCLGKLSEKDQHLILDFYEGRETAKAMAARLGRPANSVYKALQRIRRSLRECVGRQLRMQT